MKRGMVVDENMSNLTSASSEVSASSEIRNENGSLYPQLYSSNATNQEPQPKRKRSLPGHPGNQSDQYSILFSLIDGII